VYEEAVNPESAKDSGRYPEAFVQTIKRDYVRVSPCPDARTVMHQLSSWIAHYNEIHPHKLSDIVHPVSSFGLTVSARSGATTG
jgi:putative transposase